MEGFRSPGEGILAALMARPGPCLEWRAARGSCSPERNLFGAEGSTLPWIDDGQIAEEDSLAFRENLNRLSLECVDKVDACEKFAGVTRGCAEAVAALGWLLVLRV